MAFPTNLTNAEDGITPVSAALINNLEEKVGIDNSADTASLDYLIKASVDPGHTHTDGGSSLPETTELLKGDGIGGDVAAEAGTDYQLPLAAGIDYQIPLTAGVDYLAPDGDGSGLSGVLLESIGTAKGDILGFSASATPGVLAKSTNGHVLTLDDGETLGVKWAAGVAGSANWPDVTNRPDVWVDGSAGYTTIAAAVATIGAVTPCILHVTTSETITSDLTVTSNIFLIIHRGAVLTFNGSARTLRFNGGVGCAGNSVYQIFNDTTPTFGKGVVLRDSTLAKTAPMADIWVNYWGAIPDNTTDNAAAIQAAFNCYMLSNTASTLKFAGTGAGSSPTAAYGAYCKSGTTNISNFSDNIYGVKIVDFSGCFIKQTDAADAFTCTAGLTNNTWFINGTILGSNTTSPYSNYAFNVNGTSSKALKLERMQFKFWDIALYLGYGVNGGHFKNVSFHLCNQAIKGFVNTGSNNSWTMENLYLTGMNCGTSPYAAIELTGGYNVMIDGLIIEGASRNRYLYLKDMFNVTVKRFVTESTGAMADVTNCFYVDNVVNFRFLDAGYCASSSDASNTIPNLFYFANKCRNIPLDNIYYYTKDTTAIKQFFYGTDGTCGPIVCKNITTYGTFRLTSDAKSSAIIENIIPTSQTNQTAAMSLPLTSLNWVGGATDQNVYTNYVDGALPTDTVTYNNTTVVVDPTKRLFDFSSYLVTWKDKGDAAWKWSCRPFASASSITNRACVAQFFYAGSGPKDYRVDITNAAKCTSNNLVVSNDGEWRYYAMVGSDLYSSIADNVAKYFLVQLSVTPPIAAAAVQSTDAGTVTAGNHAVKIAHVDADGIGVVGEYSADVAADGSHAIDVSSIPVGPTGTTSRNVYMNTAGGTDWYLATTIGDNTTTTAQINIDDATLATQAAAPVYTLSLTGMRVHWFPTLAEAAAYANKCFIPPKGIFYNGALADDGTVVLPTTTSGGMGTVQAGDNQEYALFSYTSAGVVTLISNSANAVNTDTDTKLCIYDGGTGVYVKNRLGGSRNVVIKLW